MSRLLILLEVAPAVEDAVIVYANVVVPEPPLVIFTAVPPAALTADVASLMVLLFTFIA